MDFTTLNTNHSTFTNLQKDLPFKKIDEIELGKTYTVNAILFSKSKFGERPFVSLKEGFNVSLPKGQIDTCHSICGNADAVKSINAGKCGVKFSKYHSNRFDRECMAVEWVNIEDVAELVEDVAELVEPVF